MNLNYLKPNFSHHWLIYPFMMLFFTLGFAFSDLALASNAPPSGYVYCNTYTNMSGMTCYKDIDAYATNKWGPQVYVMNQSACDAYTIGYRAASGSYVQATDLRFGYDKADGTQSCGYQEIFLYDCNVNITQVKNACALPDPAPDQPHSCQDLTGENVTLGSTSPQACVGGCLVTYQGGVTVKLGGGEIENGYRYTGGECSSNYPPLTAEIFDQYYGGGVYTLPAESDITLQEGQHSCYTADGKFIGKVSDNVPCPNNRQYCYSETTGERTDIIESGQTCPTGSVTRAHTKKDIAKTISERVDFNPDGSTTETTTTKETQKGADGKSSYTKYTTTKTTTNPDGTTTTETSTSEETQEASEAADYSGISKCDSLPICTGDPVQCAQLEVEWRAACAFSDKNLDTLKSSAIYNKLSEGSGINTETGVLNALNGGTVNLADQFNMSGIDSDSGRSGSCPSAFNMNLLNAVVRFKYDTICDFMSALRPIVLAAAAFLCGLMIYRATVENS